MLIANYLCGNFLLNAIGVYVIRRSLNSPYILWDIKKVPYSSKTCQKHLNSKSWVKLQIAFTKVRNNWSKYVKARESIFTKIFYLF